MNAVHGHLPVGDGHRLFWQVSGNLVRAATDAMAAR
jgi:hypothetical protein